MYAVNTRNNSAEKVVKDRNLSQERATPPACNRSRDVVDHVTNRFAIFHFLFVVHWDRASISNHFHDIWPQHNANEHILTNARKHSHTRTHRHQQARRITIPPDRSN